LNPEQKFAELKVGELHDGTWIDVPMAVINGKEKGHTLLLTSGMNGKRARQPFFPNSFILFWSSSSSSLQQHRDAHNRDRSSQWN
jgi:hypothetical protein